MFFSSSRICPDSGATCRNSFLLLKKIHWAQRGRGGGRGVHYIAAPEFRSNFLIVCVCSLVCVSSPPARSKRQRSPAARSSRAWRRWPGPGGLSGGPRWSCPRSRCRWSSPSAGRRVNSGQQTLKKKHSKTLAAVSSCYSGYLFFSFLTCFECFILRWCDYQLQNQTFLVLFFPHTQLDVI